MAFSRMHEAYDLLGDSVDNYQSRTKRSNRPRTAKV